MVYHYQDTIITVRPGLGLDNYTTCKLKPSGGWTTVKSPDMPRVSQLDTAINNLHNWAKKKGLKRADCGCCFHQFEGHCYKYDQKLKTTEVVIYGETTLRCNGCDEFEKAR